MLYCRSLFLILLVCTSSAALLGQQTSSTSTQQVRRDQQALTILTQTLNAAGGAALLNAARDFKGLGTITHYWAGEEVKGAVTVRGRGTGQFRVDASLDAGVRSWAANNGTGWVREINGTVTPISYDNAINLGSLTFPFTYLASTFSDNSMSISYVGLESKAGVLVHHIRTHRVYGNDPNGILAHLTTRDFYIDQNTSQLIRVQFAVHPENFSTQDFIREVQFSDYRMVNGILVPFSITQTGNGQLLWSMQLSQISFNTSMQDSDFQP